MRTGVRAPYRKRSTLLDLFFVLAVLCEAAAIAHAEMSVRDDWISKSEVAVEGDGWTALFRKGDALVFSVHDQSVSVLPFDSDGAESSQLVSCEVTEAGSEGQIEIGATFSGAGESFDVRFLFTNYGTLRIVPGDGAEGVWIRSPMSVGVLPGLRLEDVLYRPQECPDLSEVHVPAENWFAGLLRGNNGIVACAWPDGGQRVSLLLQGDGGERVIEALKIQLGGEGLYLEILASRSIWHDEKLQLTNLEKDVALDWEPPFPATYKTQLPVRAETTTVRSFLFRENRDTVPSPEIGSYVWPVWFDEDQAWIRLSKRIPPKGHALIYPVKGGKNTLMGFLYRTPLGGIIERRNARDPLPRGPRGAPNVGFVACGGTNIVRAGLLAVGLQTREKEFMAVYFDFLADYVAIIQKRNASYFAFVEETRGKLKGWLDEQEGDLEVRAYLEEMLEHVDRVEDGHRRKMELFGDNTPEQHTARADRATERLKELLETADPEVLPECDHLVDSLNTLSWAHDEMTGMRFSMLTRQWAQDAARGCADNPGSVEYAREIRKAMRDALNGASPW